MKILQLCIKPPHPPVDGGTRAMDAITQGLLAQGHEVRVLSMSSDKHPVRLTSSDDAYRAATHFEAVPVDLAVKPLPAAVALLCGESYHVKRFESEAFATRLEVLLQEETFDVVHVESLFLTPYLPLIRRHSEARVVLRAHNVEHLIWRQIALGERRGLKRWYLKKLALALRMYELEHVGSYDGVVCITDRDADFFRSHGLHRPLVSIPYGVELPAESSVEVQPGTLFHIGAMDWEPNVESIRWFLKSVWPVLHAELPQVRLYLAGRRMPEDLMNTQLDGVVVEGEVPDANAFMSDKQIHVVPLLAGSGIRVKIIEAMAMGKAVVTTRVGAEGIHYVDGEHLLVAETPEDFVRQIRRLVSDPNLCDRLGSNARRLVAAEYSMPALTNRLVDFYASL